MSDETNDTCIDCQATITEWARSCQRADCPVHEAAKREATERANIIAELEEGFGVEREGLQTE